MGFANHDKQTFKNLRILANLFLWLITKNNKINFFSFFVNFLLYFTS